MKSKSSIAIVTCILLALSNQTRAQYSFGIYVDPQLSWFNSDTKKSDPNGSVVSFNIGFNADKYFADRYAVSSGLSLNNVGGKIRFSEDIKLETSDSSYIVKAGNTVKLKAQYLSIPIGLKFRTNQIGYLTFYGNLGLRNNIKLKGFAWDGSNDVDRETATDNFKWAYLSYFIGAGVEYSLGEESALQLGLTFTGGLTEYLDLGKGTITPRSLSLRIGVVF